MNKLSSYLYQAPGATYPWPGQPLAVDGDKYRNRLVAYLREKGTKSDSLKLADSHAEWFKVFAAEVNALESKGKYPVSKPVVASGVMHLYLLLNEIAARTDGEPITEVRAPSGPTGIAGGRQEPS